MQATAFAGADLPIYYAIGNGTPKEIYDLRLTANLTQPLSSLEFSNGLPGGFRSRTQSITRVNGAVSVICCEAYRPVSTPCSGRCSTASMARSWAATSR